MFAQGNCNDILDSPAAKFMGIIGWSEIGLSYFFSNTIILLFYPQFLSYMVILNICSLPYSLWSVWYQKFKAKNWCPLCLIVQVLFWAQFITNIGFGFIQTPDITISNLLFLCLIYSMPLLFLNLILPELAIGRKFERIAQEFNSFKMKDNIFFTLMSEQSRYEVDKQTSNILFGNTASENLLTIYTNPHCEPCARMHSRIEKLLEEADGKFCVQYILSSFSEELDSSCEFFLYINNNMNPEERNRIYHEWFEWGKYKKEVFFNKYNFTPTEKSTEYLQHKAWGDQTKITGTPVILFNGIELHDQYVDHIEYLKYFTDLDVDSK